jgi:hypothetical protein
VAAQGYMKVAAAINYFLKTKNDIHQGTINYLIYPGYDHTMIV